MSVAQWLGWNQDWEWKTERGWTQAQDLCPYCVSTLSSCSCLFPCRGLTQRDSLSPSQWSSYLLSLALKRSLARAVWRMFCFHHWWRRLAHNAHHHKQQQTDQEYGHHWYCDGDGSGGGGSGGDGGGGVCMCVCVCVCVSERERERERSRDQVRKEIWFLYH